VIATLGRLEELVESGKLDGLLRSGLKFSEQLAAIDSYKNGQAVAVEDRAIGLSLIFGRLWKELGIGSVLEELLKERKYQFPVERAVFMTTLHRLSVSGSDRAAEKWAESAMIEGAQKIELHHLYRAMAWLGEHCQRKSRRDALLLPLGA